MVASEDVASNDRQVSEVKRRLEKACLPINDKKSSYCQTSIRHLGYIIGADELRPDSEKVEGLRKVPVPSDPAELQRFVCAAGFYSKFIPNFADIAHPLRQLINAEKFVWTKTHEKSFQMLKDSLCGTVLKAYDPTQPLELTCDASSVAVGAVLQQCDRPIMYISKTLSKAERNYSQLDREALAIIYAVKRLHKFLYGRRFTIVTDHKPLEYIFKPGANKSGHANQRVIRWAVFLSGYDYEVVGRRSQEIPVADMLSRVKIDNEPQTFDVGTMDIFYQPDEPLKTDICRWFESNKKFGQLKQYVKFGWPKVLRNIPLSLRPYYRVRDDLTFNNNLLYRNGRVIIPQKLRKSILEHLHSSHLGMVKMKSLARSRYWWPGIDQEIESSCRDCNQCMKVKRPAFGRNETSWPESHAPFERVHVDYAGPVDGNYFLIVVDAFSNYPFVCKTRGETAAETLSKLKEVFGITGLPRCLVSDNGPAFRAEEFRNYFLKRGVQLWNTPPGHPKSNGLVERFVGNFKLHMKLTEGKGDIDSRLHSFLLQYRAAAVRGEKSPAERAFKFTPRMPVVLAQPGAPIFYEVFRKNEPSIFQPGTIISTSGSTCVNLKDLTGKGHIRHFEQVKIPSAVTPTKEESMVPTGSGSRKSDTNDSTPSEVNSNTHIEPPSLPEIDVTPELVKQPELVSDEPLLRRSSRPRKLPEKFGDYVLEGRR